MIRYNLESIEGPDPIAIEHREGDWIRAEGALSRIAELEARIAELTEWRRGVPVNRERHLALVMQEGSTVPVVMRWEPGHYWRMPDYRWSVDADKCIYLPIPVKL